MRLPLSLGGLGVFKQATIAPFAAAAAFVQANAILRDRGTPSLDPRRQGTGMEWVVPGLQRGASSLGLTVDDVLELPVTGGARLQRQMLRGFHLTNWKNLFLDLQEQPALQANLLELGGKLGRSWLAALPTLPHLVIPPASVRIGLRMRLLDAFDVGRTRSGMCESCHHPVHSALHHAFSCPQRSHLRSTRHEVVKTAMSTGVQADGRHHPHGGGHLARSAS